MASELETMRYCAARYDDPWVNEIAREAHQMGQQYAELRILKFLEDCGSIGKAWAVIVEHRIVENYLEEGLPHDAH